MFVEAGEPDEARRQTEVRDHFLERLVW